MLQSILPQLSILKPFIPYLLISFTVWLTYFYTLKCGFVSDDIAGIAEYDGKLQGWEYGMLWRWLRYHICGGDFPSQVKQKLSDGKEIVIPQGKLASRHHFLSIVIFNISCLVAYQSLVPILGIKISLLSVLILVVHPCTTQGVAWVSGLAYPLSLLWISVSVIILQFFYAHECLNHAIWVIPVFCFVQFLAIHAIFATTAMMWALLLFLGYWQFAILSFILSGIMCFDQIQKTVVLRITEFKKQKMGQSTVFHHRKFFVAMKTLWYYSKHIVAPISMGLYHVWGFHYDKELERRDDKFWKGLALFCLLIYIFLKVDILPIRLGILWFVIFSIGFWNWITAQQFVTERYIMVSALGLGIVIAFLTQDHLWIYTLILGLYLSRSWCHLPTYENELKFYQSNHWNFPRSEVALGNLGVTYTRIGMENTAKDVWLQATQINQDYDVPFVNMFYQYRTQGFVMINNGDYIGGFRKLQEGLPFLEKALVAKICHFPDQWKKEHLELFNAIRNPNLMLQNELKRLMALKETLRNELSKTNEANRINEISTSINDNSNQMKRLIEFFKQSGMICTEPALFGTFYTDESLSKLTRR